MRRAGATLAAAIALAVLPAASKKAEDPFRSSLAKDQRLTHVIERLSFGARPGDLDRIRLLGLDRWIDDQLHPERIAENPVLNEKLAPLTSLQMDSATLIKHYPTPQIVKAMYDGGAALPTDPLTRAAVELQLERYKVKKSEEGKQPQVESKPDQAAVRETLLKVLEPDQIATLRSGKPDEKRALLASLDENATNQVLLALPVNMRRGLIPVASPETRRKIMFLSTPQQVIPFDLNEAKLMRAIYSNRQLVELMDDFWYNHFNVFIDKGADRALVTSYERDAIRPNIFGTFRQLLQATAESPAMLFYLDNWESVAPDTSVKPGAKRKRGLNENYARELLELHTLGVDGGYTQQDIIEVARCFTGWTIRAPRQGGDFFYNDRVHDKGAKTVLGVTIAAGGGKDDAEKVLDMLAKHPSTARFISRKLAVRFVADEPPPALLDRMAKTFLSTNGDIREVMKAMIASPEFNSQGAFRSKIKTPLEMTVSAIRAMDANVDTATAITQRLNELGEPLYRKVEPTGYPSKNSEWMNSSALLGRMNFALALTQGKLTGITVPADHLNLTLATPLSPTTKETLAKAIEGLPEAQQPALTAGLLLGSPEFQRR